MILPAALIDPIVQLVGFYPEVAASGRRNKLAQDYL
jgi:hypothetical protein